MRKRTGLLTAVAVFLAAATIAILLLIAFGVGRGVNAYSVLFIALPAGLLAILMWAAVWAALDPWLGRPAMLDAGWATTLEAPLRTSPTAVVFAWILAAVSALPGALLGAVTVSEWSGMSSKPISEWGAGWLLVVFAALAAVSNGACAAGVLALLFGAPLGRRFTILFCLAGASLVGAALFSPCTSIAGYGAAGAVGLLAMLVGWLLGRRLSDRVVGFGPIARRWSGRGLLLGIALGAAAIAALMAVEVLRWNDPGHLVTGSAAGAGIGAIGGALFGALRDQVAAGACAHCGYPLRGLVGDRCPECGRKARRG